MKICEKEAHLNPLRQRERPGELAVAPLTDGIAVLGALRVDLVLARDGEPIVVHVDLHVLLLEAGQLERRGDSVLSFVLVHVNPVTAAWSVPGSRCPNSMGMGRAYRGRNVPEVRLDWAP